MCVCVFSPARSNFNLYVCFSHISHSRTQWPSTVDANKALFDIAKRQINDIKGKYLLDAHATIEGKSLSFYRFGRLHTKANSLCEKIERELNDICTDTKCEETQINEKMFELIEGLQCLLAEAYAQITLPPSTTESDTPETYKNVFAWEVKRIKQVKNWRGKFVKLVHCMHGSDDVASGAVHGANHQTTSKDLEELTNALRTYGHKIVSGGYQFLNKKFAAMRKVSTFSEILKKKCFDKIKRRFSKVMREKNMLKLQKKNSAKFIFFQKF